MAFPVRTRTIPHCSKCISNHVWTILGDYVAPISSLRQQVRGKKKMANNSGTMTVRLLKDVPLFGRKGSIVPIPTGMMRNKWFPLRIADYITPPDLKRLRLENVPIGRDFQFGYKPGMRKTKQLAAILGEDAPEPVVVQAEESSSNDQNKVLGIEEMPTERSMELLEIFVPRRVDFYRAVRPEQDKQQDSQTRSASSAGADLLAARTYSIQAMEQRRLIYGSVSTSDILIAIKAALETNDEAKRVRITEEDVKIVEFTVEDVGDAGKIRRTGEYKLEIKVKGTEKTVSRMLRIMPSET